MDNNAEIYNGSGSSSLCYILCSQDMKTDKEIIKNDLGGSVELGLFTVECQTKQYDHNTFGITIKRSGTLDRKAIVASRETMSNDDKNCLECNSSTEPFCHVKLEALIKLKDSTRKLLCLLEEIQSKMHMKNNVCDESPKLNELLKPIPPSDEPLSVTDVIGADALKKLEYQTKALDAIYIEDEDKNCSVYNRLTRKCHCLNQQVYNDFIIHFNEDTKYYTSNSGEIIKNMRILKKFLYMGGGYTKNALMFLNEGLTDSSHTEKVEIIQGCSYADICNVFDDHSIVTACVSWPCKYEHFGDSMTQMLAAGFLNKLAQLEEGRRYLNFNSKITNDIKKVLRKKASKLDYNTLEALNGTLNLLHPPLPQHVNVTYYCRPVDEGLGNRTVNALVQYRQYMTLDEVFMHLDVINNLSNKEKGKTELTLYLPALLILFKHMLLEYDNSEMNIVITNILNNMVSKNMVKDKDIEQPKAVMIADTATEPIQMKNEMNQVPPKKNNTRKNNKSKLGLGSTPNKHRQPSRRKVSDMQWESTRGLNRSKKFTGDLRNSIIVVPIE